MIIFVVIRHDDKFLT